MPSKIPVSKTEYTEIAKVTGEGSLLTQLQNMQSLLTIQDPFIFQNFKSLSIKTWDMNSRPNFGSEQILREAWFHVRQGWKS